MDGNTIACAAAGVVLILCLVIVIFVFLSPEVFGIVAGDANVFLPRITAYQLSWLISKAEWEECPKIAGALIPHQYPEFNVDRFLASQLGTWRPGNRPYVATVRITDGLGNRLFEILALLAYCDFTGIHTPIVYTDTVEPNPHSNNPLRCMELFPYINVHAGSLPHPYQTLTEKEAQIHTPMPKVNTNVFITGYRQSGKYFQSSPFLPVLHRDYRDAILNRFSTVPFSNAVFVHCRRGDYVGNSALGFNLIQYWHNCARLRAWSGIHIVLITNDAAWAVENVTPIFLENGVEAVHPLPESMEDVEVLTAMAMCQKGGVCANSSLSWIGAFLAREMWGPDVFVTFPDKWIRGSPSKDIYPEWGIIVPLSSNKGDEITFI